MEQSRKNISVKRKNNKNNKNKNKNKKTQRRGKKWSKKAMMPWFKRMRGGVPPFAKYQHCMNKDAYDNIVNSYPGNESLIQSFLDKEGKHNNEYRIHNHPYI